jgi:xanthine dehydrogenase YagR molybdenum-binding subunit
VDGNVMQVIGARPVEEHDPHASLLGARGIGELGAVGVAPAILNAVYHATGKRVRDLPIRIECLLELPS